MALSTLAKEQENFLRYAILIVDHTKEALQDLIELNLKNKHLTFEEFLNKHKHEIYHLCYDFECCQCLTPPTKRKRIIIPPQLELLFDKYNKLPSHKGTGHNDFCCSYAKVGITSQVLDLSLARCLLMNCCLDVFWFTCLTSQDQTLEQFLNSNKHIIYHLWKNNQNCCQCPSGFIFPCDRSIITEHEWKSMFSSQLSPCENHRKRISSGSSSICSVGATPGIATQDINPEIQRFILQKCSHISKAVDFLVEQRNSRFAHVPEARIPDSDFRLFLKDIENHLLGIARVCGKETHVKKILRDLHLKPLSLNMLRKYEKQLHENTEAINKNINLQHRTTRQSIPKLVDKSIKITKIEERVDALETSVTKITEKVQDLSKIIKERSKRQRLIDQTFAEIESHESDGTYLEVGAVKHCVKLLESRNVVILSGREGSGKSRNGLEILKQLKEKNKNSDVFKLIGLHYVSDIVKSNVTSIVLFDDAFDKTSKQFSNDKQVLDHLHSYLTPNKVKIIFTMRNTVRHGCKMLLSTHKLFRDFFDIDLHSENFKLTKVEKENILIRYCDINRIKILEGEGDNTDQSVFNEAATDDTDTVQTVSDQVSFVNREMINEIIQTDPFLGFPECCRLFTENRNNTTLDTYIFKWPSHTLLKDFEKLRIEGKHDYISGLKYAALICILTMGKSNKINEYYKASNFKTVHSLHETTIDVKVCEELLKECCNKEWEVRESDIKHVFQELTSFYVVKKGRTYYFQHAALQDVALVSYSMINTKAVIPLLSIDHMMALVHLQCYIEQENETVIKISKQYYNDLAIHFMSFLDHHCDYTRLLKCNIITENDIDFMYQLLLCVHDKSETSLLDKGMNFSHYFPLYLLRNIGKLDDNKLTINHTQDQLLIAIVLEGQTITFTVDPSMSLFCAFEESNNKVIIWLAKHTDHSLLHLENILYSCILDRHLRPMPLLLQNFNHNQFDMTDILFFVCTSWINGKKHIIDWIIDNIDSSRIDYNKVFQSDEIVEYLNLENYFNLILQIGKKVNRINFDVYKAVQWRFINLGIEIVERVLQDVDNRLLDEEELINIMIDDNDVTPHIIIDYNEEDYDKIVERLLQATGVRYRDLNRLVGVAAERGWLNVLELLFKHDSDKSFHTYKGIKDELQQFGNDKHCENTIPLIIKYYVDYIDVDKMMKKAIDVGCHRVVKALLLKKIDNISYYLDIAIDKFMFQQTFHYASFFEKKQEKIVEQLLLATGVRYRNLSKLVGVASERGWCNVLELIFKNDSDKSFHIVIENALQQLGNGFGYWDKTIPIIVKYYLDYIDVNILMEKAIDVGCHEVVEDLLLKKVDKISYYLDITIDKLRHQQLIYGFKSFERDHGKILLLLLQKNNTKLIDLNSIMNDVCHIGHSPAIHWLLENKPSFFFDIRKVMNNACFRGDLELVDYLFQKYSAADFDYKTAMIKACRHAQSNTLDVCKWLWRHIDRSMFDMKAALNNASKYDNTENVKWILTDVDTELYDIEAAVLSASEHGNEGTLKLLLNQSGLNMLDIQSALTLSCRNDRNCLGNAILLYRRANKSIVDMNAVLSEACKYYRTDYIQWIIETCDTNITVFETNDGHKHFIKSLDKHRVDMDQAVTCILGMEHPAQKKEHVNKTKKQLLMLILKQFDPSIIYIYTLLAETCKNDWVEIFQLILEKVDHACFNIGEIINVACGFGAFKVIKWSLENIDMQLVDVDNVLVESCAFGRLDCLFLILKHCNQSKLQEAMTEACTYGRLNIAEWLLQNVHYQLFNIQMLLQEAGRNGWINIFTCLLQNFHFDRSDMHIATSQALENGHLEIAELVISTVGKDCFDFCPSLSESTYVGANKEGVVKFLLHNIDHRSIDIATIMTNACLFGWKDVATFIVDNDLSSLCDLSLAFNTACDNGELEIAQYLLEKVEPRSITTVDKAMHAVAVKGWDEIALLLIDNVEHTRLDIGNAFIEACRHGEIDVVQAILRKVNNKMLDVGVALDKACENHMHQELVLWILENIDKEQVDLKTVKIQAVRHKWRKVQFALAKISIEDLNQAEQETETDNIVILE